MIASSPAGVTVGAVNSRRPKGRAGHVQRLISTATRTATNRSVLLSLGRLHKTRFERPGRQLLSLLSARRTWGALPRRSLCARGRCSVRPSHNQLGLRSLRAVATTGREVRHIGLAAPGRKIGVDGADKYRRAETRLASQRLARAACDGRTGRANTVPREPSLETQDWVDGETTRARRASYRARQTSDHRSGGRTAAKSLARRSRVFGSTTCSSPLAGDFSENSTSFTASWHCEPSDAGSNT
jgi:hypothetical protein